MPDAASRPAVLISRILPEESLRLARSRADVDLHEGENCLAVLEGRTPPTPVNPEALERC